MLPPCLSSLPQERVAAGASCGAHAGLAAEKSALRGRFVLDDDQWPDVTDAVSFYRLSRRLHRRGLRRAAAVVKGASFFLFKASIPPELEAGSDFKVGHRGLAVVIHKSTTLGDGVFISHNVTLATDVSRRDPRRMRVGNRVRIGAGATWSVRSRLETKWSSGRVPSWSKTFPATSSSPEFPLGSSLSTGSRTWSGFRRLPLLIGPAPVP